MGRRRRALVALSFYLVVLGSFVAAGFNPHSTVRTHREASPPRVTVTYYVDACISEDGDKACRKTFRQACGHRVKDACAVASSSTTDVGRAIGWTISNRP